MENPAFSRSSAQTLPPAPRDPTHLRRLYPPERAPHPAPPAEPQAYGCRAHQVRRSDRSPPPSSCQCASPCHSPPDPFTAVVHGALDSPSRTAPPVAWALRVRSIYQLLTCEAVLAEAAFH